MLCEIMDEEDSVEDDRYIVYNRSLLQKMIRRCYLFWKSKYQKKCMKFDLEIALSFISINFNDKEFLSSFRITRKSFFWLLEEMKQQRRDFLKISNTKQQCPITFQLLVFL